MRSAVSIAGEVVAPSDSAQSSRVMPAVASGAAVVSTEKALAQLERCATELGKLKRNHRNATLGAVANGTLTADAAIVRVDTLRSLEALAHHAWRAAVHLVGRVEEHHVPASSAVTDFFSASDERMTNFSASTTTKNSRPPARSRRRSCYPARGP